MSVRPQGAGSRTRRSYHTDGSLGPAEEAIGSLAGSVGGIDLDRISAAAGGACSTALNATQRGDSMGRSDLDSSTMRHGSSPGRARPNCPEKRTARVDGVAPKQASATTEANGGHGRPDERMAGGGTRWATGVTTARSETSAGPLRRLPRSVSPARSSSARQAGAGRRNRDICRRSSSDRSCQGAPASFARPRSISSAAWARANAAGTLAPLRPDTCLVYVWQRLAILPTAAGASLDDG